MKASYKIVAALLVMGAAGAQLLNRGYAGWDAGFNSVCVLAMLVIFFWKERPEDERVRELKLKALMTAFAFGYVAIAAVKLSLKHSRLAGGMSAYDFMFVTLVMAFGLFHGWRWEDGRQAPGDQPGP